MKSFTTIFYTCFQNLKFLNYGLILKKIYFNFKLNIILTVKVYIIILWFFPAFWSNLLRIALTASLGPSSVSLIISQISILSDQFSEAKPPSVANSIKKKNNLWIIKIKNTSPLILFSIQDTILIFSAG